jgi:hypothetical protein
MGNSLRAAILGMSLLAAGSGCGGDDSDATPGANVDKTSELLAPPAEGKGVQYSMITTLAPGEEAEHCMFVQAPADGMLVQHDEVRFTTGSHHVLLYETAYDTIPTQKMDGTVVDTSGVFDCTQGATDGWEVTKLIGGSQNGQGESLLAFPEGIAVRVRPSTVLLVNVHYINASSNEIKPEVRINLYTISEDSLKQEGDLLFLYNAMIKVPADGTSRARMRCPVHKDITIANVQSHMHRRGVGYAAMVEGEDAFYENDHWEDVPVKHFGDGLQVKAGQRLDYYCDYQSMLDHDIYQGARSTDEMCMLIGSYYPADPATSGCREEDDERTAAEWVGNGDKSCKDTLKCVQDGTRSGLPALTDCMLASDPAVSKEVSAMLRCTFMSQDAAHDCAPEIKACQAK